MRSLPPSLLALSVVVCALNPLPSEERQLESQVDAVTVYLDRAVVTRHSSLRLESGRHHLVIGPLPMDVEGAFVRPRVDNNRGITIEGQTLRVQAAQRVDGDGIAELQQELEGLQWELGDYERRLSDNSQAQELLTSIQKVLLTRAASSPVADAPPPPDLAELSKLQSYYEQERSRLSERERELRRAVNQVQQQRQDIQQRINSLRGPTTPPHHEVVVTLVVDQDAPWEGALSLDYLLPGALWYPAYEAHDSGEGQLALEVAAVIQNATGEDWDNARLTLSSARHRVNLMPEELRPWRVDAELAQMHRKPQKAAEHSYVYQNPALGNAAPEESLRQQLGNRATQRERQAHQQLLVNVGRITELSDILQRRSATLAIAVPQREWVRASGEPQRISLGRFALASELRYVVRPELSRNVSTFADGQWAGPWPLLPGEVQMQRDGVILGQFAMPFVAPGEDLTLPLGVEERVLVTHQPVEADSTRSTFSGSHRLTSRQRIEVSNLLERDITIDIAVRLPVSDSDEIRIQHHEATPAFTSNEQGLAHWQLRVPGTKKQTVEYGFQMEWPTSLELPSLKELWAQR